MVDIHETVYQTAWLDVLCVFIKGAVGFPSIFRLGTWYQIVRKKKSVIVYHWLSLFKLYAKLWEALSNT